MRAIDKMVEWLEKEAGKIARIDRSGDTWQKEILANSEMETYLKAADKARSLAAEKTDEATEKGLREGILDVCEAWKSSAGPYATVGMGAAIKAELSRHQIESEPLAVLADRKGCSLTKRIELVNWLEGEDKKTIWHEFTGTTYSAAEATARAYLNSLPDMNKEK